MKKTRIDVLKTDSGKLGLDLNGGTPTGPELEEILFALAVERSNTLPPVAAEAQVNDKPTAFVTDPDLSVEKAIDGSTILSIRHPGFGWIHARMPPARRKWLKDNI